MSKLWEATVVRSIQSVQTVQLVANTRPPNVAFEAVARQRNAWADDCEVIDVERPRLLFPNEVAQ